MANRRYIVRIALIVALGGFLMGFDASVISGVVKFIEPQCPRVGNLLRRPDQLGRQLPGATGVSVGLGQLRQCRDFLDLWRLRRLRSHLHHDLVARDEG